MRRRDLLVWVTGLVATLRFPLAAAQPAVKVPRVGYLSLVSAGAPGHVIFRRSLRELGYVDGQNIVLQGRFADGDVARLPALAAALVRQNVDVIVGTSMAPCSYNSDRHDHGG